ncbi:MAG: ANTAR domain-containing protein, partial [Acholeplasmatales bacterium]|nr:ANTAR domain-containing protein [Acholeplasmatales bacterium]
VNNSLDAYKDKINEERLVRKAKLYLMNEYNIDEEEAYKKILRKSMDERISKLQAAKNILGGR